MVSNVAGEGERRARGTNLAQNVTGEGVRGKGTGEMSWI